MEPEMDCYIRYATWLRCIAWLDSIQGIRLKVRDIGATNSKRWALVSVNPMSYFPFVLLTDAVSIVRSRVYAAFVAFSVLFLN